MIFIEKQFIIIQKSLKTLIFYPMSFQGLMFEYKFLIHVLYLVLLNRMDKFEYFYELILKFEFFFEY
jgi:hypothetical protein